MRQDNDLLKGIIPDTNASPNPLAALMKDAAAAAGFNFYWSGQNMDYDQGGRMAGLAAHMTEDQKKRRQAGLDETRELTGRFEHYLTGLSPRETPGTKNLDPDQVKPVIPDNICGLCYHDISESRICTRTDCPIPFKQDCKHNRGIDMSKIGDMNIRAEESEDERLKQWRENTRKMYELAEQWDGVYQQIDGVIGKKQGKKHDRQA